MAPKSKNQSVKMSETLAIPKLYIIHTVEKQYACVGLDADDVKRTLSSGGVKEELEQAFRASVPNSSMYKNEKLIFEAEYPAALERKSKGGEITLGELASQNGFVRVHTARPSAISIPTREPVNPVTPSKDASTSNNVNNPANNNNNNSNNNTNNKDNKDDHSESTSLLAGGLSSSAPAAFSMLSSQPVSFSSSSGSMGPPPPTTPTLTRNATGDLLPPDTPQTPFGVPAPSSLDNPFSPSVFSFSRAELERWRKEQDIIRQQQLRQQKMYYERQLRELRAQNAKLLAALNGQPVPSNPQPSPASNTDSKDPNARQSQFQARLDAAK